jgi:glycine/serine hydroxymethyltransferase
MHVIAAKAVAQQRAAAGVPRLSEQIVRNARGWRPDDEKGFPASGVTDNHLLLIDLRNSELPASWRRRRSRRRTSR